MKPSLFIVSTSEQTNVVDAIELNLEPVADITSWRHAFRPGHHTIEDLINAKDKFDFAVIILTPSDIVHSKDKVLPSTRDNVIFELGLFLGSLGAGRVFPVIEEGLHTKIMSDYAGVTIATYRSRRTDKDLIGALSPACIRIKHAINELGTRNKKIEIKQNPIDSSKIGLSHIYDNYETAEHAILDDLKNSSGLIRLFFHIASQNIGIKGSLFDIVHDLALRSENEVRILHASPFSPLFARDRLMSLGKNPDFVLASLRYVNNSLKEIQSSSNTSLRNRHHDYPFIWRVYGFSERLYLMPYFNEKDATKYSPVVVFEKRKNSMYQSFSDWFDHVWEAASPSEIELNSLITPATPAGTALFLNWDGFNVFGIPKRDIIDNSDYLRFYGIGGKKDNPKEDFEACALREGNEETGSAIKELTDSKRTDFFRSNGTIQSTTIFSKSIKPRLIYEKREHSSYGYMKERDEYYYMVGFNATLLKEPVPNREIAALLYLTDEHLSKFSKRNDITLAEILKEGGVLHEQAGISIRPDKILVPHGTASYLVRLKAD